MADPGRGHRFFIQLGKEGTYGTPVAATGVRLWGYNFKAEPQLGDDQEEALHGGISIRENYQLGRFWEWEYEVDLNYIGMLKYLNMVMGEDAGTNPTVTGPDGNGIYTHTFKEGKTVPFYTGEVQEGGVGGVVTVSQFAGMMAEKFAVSGKSGTSGEARLKGKISGIARSRTTGVTAAALTLANPRAALYHHNTVTDEGSADPASNVLIRGWGIDIMSALDRERFPFGSSQLLAAPVRTKHFRAEMTFNQEWQTETQYTNYLANADLSPEMEFTGPETIGASGKRSIKFTMNKSRIIDLKPPVNEFGPLKNDIKHLGLFSTDTSLVVTVKTDQATIVLG